MVADYSIINGTREHGKIQLYRLCWNVHRPDYPFVDDPPEQSYVPA